MEKEFVPYDRALILKALGFDEPCLGVFELIVVGDTIPKFRYNWESEDRWFNHNKEKNKFKDHDWYWSAPLYQQAFKWFREKCNTHYNLFAGANKWSYVIAGDLGTDTEEGFNSHEEAQLACLDKLIEYCQKLK